MEHNCLKVNELAVQLAHSLQNTKVSTADPLKKRTSSYRGLSSEPIITEEEPAVKNDYNKFYSQHSDKQVLDNKPWLQDGNYFKTVYISTIALLKMMSHARSGGSIEIMGMLTGKVFANTLVVMDCYLLPVEGTETRVNAQAEGYEFMVSYLDNLKEINHNENIIGWYHSHPGYGCWLSGIDVATQDLNQKFQDPYLAIVIDPERSVRQGFVEIGAFRTFTEPTIGRSSSSASSVVGAGISDVAFSSGRNSASGMSSVLSASNMSIAEELSKQTINRNVFDTKTTKIPKGKMTDFGAHSGKYYSLEVKVFRSPLEERLLDTLGSKTWIKGLTNYSNVVNAEETQIELMHKVMEATENLRKESPSKLPSLVMGNLVYSSASQGVAGNRKRSMSKSCIYSGLQASLGIPSSRYPTKGRNMSGTQFNDDALARSVDETPSESLDQQYDGALSIQQPKRSSDTHTSRTGNLASVLSSGCIDPASYSMVGRMSLANQSPGSALRGLNTPPNKRPQRSAGHTSSPGGTPGGAHRSKEKINKPIGISMISKDFKVVVSQQVKQMLRRHIQNDLFGSTSPSS